MGKRGVKKLSVEQRLIKAALEYDGAWFNHEHWMARLGKTRGVLHRAAEAYRRQQAEREGVE